MTKEKLILFFLVAFVFVFFGMVIFFQSEKENIFQKKKNDLPSNFSSKTLSPQEAVQRALDFINENKAQFGLTSETKISFSDVTEVSGIYKFNIKINEVSYPSYITKDGKIFFTGGIDLEGEKTKKEQVQKEAEESLKSIPKSEKPDFKIFVMSYCPYGLQAQKAFLGVYDLLKDKAEMGIYFVDYIMHGKQELEENLRQYCIQKEQKNKFSSYLRCFIGENGNSEKCLTQSAIDKEKLSACVSKTDKDFKITQNYSDKEPYSPFPVHSDLNKKYGVRGSPTFVINDKVVSVDRSPEALKKVICQTFNNPPSECEQKLSEQVFGPGFGWQTGNSSGGGCQ